jgi:hypothetical protein
MSLGCWEGTLKHLTRLSNEKEWPERRN